MASIRKKDSSWVAEVRRAGHKSITRSFPTKGAATTWARGVEAEMDAIKYQDVRSISDMPLATLIDRYCLEFDTKERPFRRNKKAVLGALRKLYGETPVVNLTSKVLMERYRNWLSEGISGVTVAIELTYLGGVLRTAKNLWKLPVSLDPLDEVRATLNHMHVNSKSTERSRRATDAELSELIAFFRSRINQKIPMWDLIPFAVATTMRAGEICRLRWEDLNMEDKTIIIRDRKHPLEKIGNDQVVPLLGEAFEIVMRQERVEGDPRIFRVKENSISTIFPRACDQLGILDLRFHDLRHEGISRLFAAGYGIPQVALVSGHRDWKSLKRYTHVTAKDLHRAPAVRQDGQPHP